MKTQNNIAQLNGPTPEQVVALQESIIALEDVDKILNIFLRENVFLIPTTIASNFLVNFLENNGVLTFGNADYIPLLLKDVWQEWIWSARSVIAITSFFAIYLGKNFIPENFSFSNLFLSRDNLKELKEKSQKLYSSQEEIKTLIKEIKAHKELFEKILLSAGMVGMSLVLIDSMGRRYQQIFHEINTIESSPSHSVGFTFISSLGLGSSLQGISTRYVNNKRIQDELKLMNKKKDIANKQLPKFLELYSLKAISKKTWEEKALEKNTLFSLKFSDKKIELALDSIKTFPTRIFIRELTATLHEIGYPILYLDDLNLTTGLPNADCDEKKLEDAKRHLEKRLKKWKDIFLWREQKFAQLEFISNEIFKHVQVSWDAFYLKDAQSQPQINFTLNTKDLEQELVKKLYAILKDIYGSSYVTQNDRGICIAGITVASDSNVSLKLNLLDKRSIAEENYYQQEEQQKAKKPRKQKKEKGIEKTIKVPSKKINDTDKILSVLKAAHPEKTFYPITTPWVDGVYFAAVDSDKMKRAVGQVYLSRCENILSVGVMRGNSHRNKNKNYATGFKTTNENYTPLVDNNNEQKYSKEENKLEKNEDSQANIGHADAKIKIGNFRMFFRRTSEKVKITPDNENNNNNNEIEKAVQILEADGAVLNYHK